MKPLASGLICTVLLVQIVTATEDLCGFPGTPAYGYVKPDKDVYEEGDVVSYNCRVGYILLGSPISRCTKDGIWSEDVPICDDSMTALGSAASTATVPNYPAEMAIDRDKTTCTYLKPKKNRWWRIVLGGTHKVLSVAVSIKEQDKAMKFTINVVQNLDGIASYKKCATFFGKFGTPTIVLSCAEGKGIIGDTVHIDDHMEKDTLEICEVEVQVEKDTGYDCGRPSRSLNSFTYDPRGKIVDYECFRGYEIVGRDQRRCLSTGQWSEEPPKCIPIICEELEELEDGKIEFSHNNEPILEGTIAIYSCKEGYKLEGTFTRNCLKDGSWSGRLPKCRAIRCPLPDGKAVGGVYRLVNNTNSMGSRALLRCKKGKREGDNPYLTCTEDSVWTEPEAKCILPAGTFSEDKEEPRIAYQGVIIFGMIVAAVMIVVVLVAMYLYTQKRRNDNKPEIPSRIAEPLPPPPRPPPRGEFKAAFMSFISRDSNDKSENQKEVRNSWYGSGSQNQDDPAVIEVEVLASEDKRKGVYPVPEENENTSLENVVLDVDEKRSERAASPKEQKSESDYAAVDYDKKRQSRLLKEQDSIDSSSTAAASPIPPDESEKEGISPTHKPARESEEESEEEEEEDENEQIKQQEEKNVKEEDERKAKEEDKRAKEDQEKKAQEEEEKKVKEEAEQKEKVASSAPGSRRRRLREDPPPPVIEERPALRRVRQSRLQ